MIFSYLKEVPSNLSESEKISNSQQLAISSIYSIEKGLDSEQVLWSDQDNYETLVFNSETHLQFIRDNYRYFGCEFDKWVVCLIGENRNVNRKFSKYSHKRLVGCLNHNLNIEVNKMVKETTDPEQNIASVHKKCLQRNIR